MASPFLELYSPEARAAALAQVAPGAAVPNGVTRRTWGYSPQPLGSTGTAPAFPVDVLPPWVREQVEAVAHFTQTALDLPGVVSLGVLAAIAGGRVSVEPDPGWVEPANLYTVVGSSPGTRKSAVFRAMTEPLREAESRLVSAARPAIVQADTAKKIAEKVAENARIAAGRAVPANAAKLSAEAISAAQIADSAVVPPLPRLLADDITPEAAASLLCDHGGRLVVASAEGGLFDTLAGRYSNNVPNLDWALKAHAGDTMRVDRKGRATEYVDAPALTMILTVQPSVLAAVGKNPAFRGRGLLARFLYALPETNVGRRRIDPASVPPAVSSRYVDTVRDMAVQMHGIAPVSLHLTGDARDALRAFQRDIEPRLLADVGDLGSSVLLTEWGSKVVGATVRLAGLLHIASSPLGWQTLPVSVQSVEGAIRLSAYFIAHAKAVFEQIDNPQAGPAQQVLRYLADRNFESFTKRDLFSGLSRKAFPQMAVLDAALSVLEAHGWIEPLPEVESSGPGRKRSPSYSVHPEIQTAESAQYAQPHPVTSSADSADSAETARAI